MLERLRAARANEEGFTLVELLIVIVILGVLAGIVVFSVSGVTNNSKVTACKADLQSVISAAEAFYASPVGGAASTYPTQMSDMVPKFLHNAPPAADAITYLSVSPFATYTVTSTVC